MSQKNDILNEMVQAAIEADPVSVTCYGEKPASDRGIYKIINKALAVSMLLVTAALMQSSCEKNTHLESIAQPAAVIQYDEDIDTITYDHITERTDLSEKLFDDGNLFLSLATMIENVKTEVYYDSGGANIGMGYCIDRQIKDSGVDAVLHDLKRAKIPNDQAALLIGSKREKSRAHITVTQAVNLLDITTDRYRSAAKSWLGNDNFESLTDMQKTAITYLTYNVGANHIHGFKRLKAAILDGHDERVKKNLAPMFRDASGAWQKNRRVGDVLSVTWNSSADKKFSPI